MFFVWLSVWICLDALRLYAVCPYAVSLYGVLGCDGLQSVLGGLGPSRVISNGIGLLLWREGERYRIMFWTRGYGPSKTAPQETIQVPEMFGQCPGLTQEMFSRHLEMF